MSKIHEVNTRLEKIALIRQAIDTIRDNSEAVLPNAPLALESFLRPLDEKVDEAQSRLHQEVLAIADKKR